MSPTIQ